MQYEKELETAEHKNKSSGKVSQNEFKIFNQNRTLPVPGGPYKSKPRGHC